MAVQIGPQWASEFELALLVLNYLEDNGWTKTATSFKKEAKDLFPSDKRPTERVLSLPQIVNGYLQSVAIEQQRSLLHSLNPLARSMHALLENAAGVLPSALPTAVAQPPQPPQQQAVLQHEQAPGGNTAPSYQQPPAQGAYPQEPQRIAPGVMVPIGDIGGGTAPQQPRQPQQTQQPQVTPGRHAQRKGAPKKRRRLEEDFEEAGGLSFLFPPDNMFSNRETSPDGLTFDLLNREVDPVAAQHILDHNGEDINRFSSLLADTINRQAAMHNDQPLEDFAANGLDNSLTEVLNVPEFADFLKKLVGSEESLPPTAPAAQPNQDRSRHNNSGHKLTSPSRGRVRPESRTEARPGGRKREEGGAAVAAEGGISDHHHSSSSGGGGSLPAEIAEYLNKPDEFEDLLDECCG